MLKTTNLDLNKPEGSDAVNIDDLNENADIIDEKFAGGSAGHKHTGAAGDGAPIPINGIEAAAKTTAGGNQANRLAVTGENGRVGDAERLAGLTLAQLDQRVDSTITGAHLLNKIKAVDGQGSGLDADLVRGRDITSSTGQLIARNGYGDTMTLGGDDAGNDYEIHLSEPNRPLNLWSVQGDAEFATDKIVARKSLILKGVELPQIRLNNGKLEYLDGTTWKVVGGVKSVQRGLAQLTADQSNEETINVTISPVNLSKSFVNISQTGNLPAGVRVRLTSGTNLEIYLRSVAQLTGINYISWEVIEYA